MNLVAVNITKSTKANKIKFYLMRFTKDTGREIAERSCQVMRSYLKRPHKFPHLYTEYFVFSWRSYFGRLWRLGGSKSLGRGVEVWLPVSTSRPVSAPWVWMQSKRPPHTPHATSSLPWWAVCPQRARSPFLKLLLIRAFSWDYRGLGTGARCGLNVKCLFHPHRRTCRRTCSLASATVLEKLEDVEAERNESLGAGREVC